MWPYLVLPVVILAAGILLGEVKKSKLGVEILFWTSGAVMILMTALRARDVGYDTYFYMDFLGYVRNGGLPYLFSPSNPYRYEPGYTLLNYLAGLVTDNPQFFLAVAGALTVGLRLIAIRRISTNLWQSLFFYVSFGFFGYSMCTMRQELAITVAFFAYPFLRDRKPLPYFLLVLLASAFHRSLLILIPVYFLVLLPFKKPTLIFYGISTVLGFLLARPMIFFLAGRFAPGYLVDTQFLEGRNLQTAFVPILVCVLAIFLHKKVLEKDPKDRALLHLCVYSAALFTLTLNVFLFQRLALIFFPFTIFLLPKLMECLDVAPGDFGLSGEEKQLAKGKGRAAYLTKRKEYRDAKALYYTLLGITLAMALLYQFFLLANNRLGIVPYRLFF